MRSPRWPKGFNPKHRGRRFTREEVARRRIHEQVEQRIRGRYVAGYEPELILRAIAHHWREAALDLGSELHAARFGGRPERVRSLARRAYRCARWSRIAAEGLRQLVEG